MPPRCESLDGPVGVTARNALAAEHVDLLFPFVRNVGRQAVTVLGSEASPRCRDSGLGLGLATPITCRRHGTWWSPVRGLTGGPGGSYVAARRTGTGGALGSRAE
jgi:hypothetical protein